MPVRSAVIMALLCLFITGLITTSIYRGMKSAIDRSGKISADSAHQENSTAMVAMNGIRDVLIYRQQPVFFKSYQDACRKGKNARSFLTIAPPFLLGSWRSAGFS